MQEVSTLYGVYRNSCFPFLYIREANLARDHQRLHCSASRAHGEEHLESVLDISANDCGKLLIEGCRQERVLVDGLHQVWRPIGEHNICYFNLSCT